MTEKINSFEATRMLAFRTIDSDNDVWCEEVFILKNQTDAKLFFVKDNNILLDVFTETENRVLNDFTLITIPSNGDIIGVKFRTEYAGQVLIKEMSKGFICNHNSNHSN